jgi:hypothetical protein
MNRVLMCTGVALLLSIAPALAADDSATVPSSGSPDNSTGAAQSTSTPPGSMKGQQDSSDPAAKTATVPPAGSADKSSGAAQSTSTPPKSGY